MRRRKPAERFRPVLKSSAIALAASIDDTPDGADCRFLLVRYPDSWAFKSADDHRLDGKIESVTIERRHPDGIPGGRYLRVPVGLSDHSAGAQAAVAAVALGACVYERHLVLEDDMEAIDRPVSSTPSELKQLIATLEVTRRSLGDGRKVRICRKCEGVVDK